MDLARSVSLIGGGKDSALYRFIVPTLRKAEGRMIEKNNRTIKAVDEAARAAGFRNFNHLRNCCSERNGRAMTQYFTFTTRRGTDQEQVVQITLGEALHLLAIDPDILERMDVERKNKAGDFIEATLDIIAFRSDIAQQNPELADLVAVMKEQMELSRVDAYKAIREVTGTEPEVVQGYFPAGLDKDSIDTGIDKTPTVIIDNYGNDIKSVLTTQGFTKDRVSNKKPVLLQDGLELWFDHMKTMHSMSEFLVPTKDIDSMLKDSVIKKQIEETYGKNTLETLRMQILASSRMEAGRPLGTLDKIFEGALGNLAASVLTISPRTWAKMYFGGTASLLYSMDTKFFLEGLRPTFSKKLYRQMIEDSPYIRDRLFGQEGYSRFSGHSYNDGSLEGEAETLGLKDNATLENALAQFYGALANTNNLSLKERGAAVYGALKGVRGSIRILQTIDAGVCMVAYKGYLAEADQLLPDATPEQKRKYAAEKASDALRETQNVTSPMDDAGWATTIKTKSGFASITKSLLLFQSDPMKKTTMIMEELQKKKLGQDHKLGKAVAAVSGNMVASFGANALIASPFAMVISKLFGFEDDILQEIEEEERTARRIVGGVARDTTSLIPLSEPLANLFLGLASSVIGEAKDREMIGDDWRLLNATEQLGKFAGRDPLQVASIETISSALRSFGRGFDKALEGNFRGVTRQMVEATKLFGNPLYIPMAEWARDFESRKTKGDRVLALGAYFEKALKDVESKDIPDEVSRPLYKFVDMYKEYRSEERKVKRKYGTQEEIKSLPQQERNKLNTELENELQELLVTYLTELQEGTGLTSLYNEVKNFDIRPSLEMSKERQENFQNAG
jgi:hypothetical protein